MALSRNTVLVEYKLDDNGVPQKVRALNHDMRDSESAGEGAARGVGSLSKALGALSAALVAKKMYDFGKAIMVTGAQFESLRKQLEVVEGSVRGAANAFEYIQQKEREAPYTIQQITESYVKLKAMGLDPMAGALDAVTNAASYTQSGMEGVERVSNALAKGFVKGKLQAEELMMLMEAKVPAVQLLAKSFGVSEAAIFKMSEKAQLGRDAVRRLIDEMNEMYSGANQMAMDTLTGKWSSFQSAVSKAMNELASGGAMEAAKRSIDGMISLLDEMRERGDLEAMARSFGAAMKIIAGSLEVTIAGLKLAVDLFGKLGQAIEGIAGAPGQDDVSTRLTAMAQALQMAYPTKTLKEIHQLTGMTTEEMLKYIDSIDDVSKVSSKWQEIITYLNALLEENAAATVSAADATEVEAEAHSVAAMSADEHAKAMKRLHDVMLSATQMTFAAWEAIGKQSIEARAAISKIWEGDGATEAISLIPIPDGPEVENRLSQITEIWKRHVSEMQRTADNTLKDVLFLAASGRLNELPDLFKGVTEQLAAIASETLVDAVKDKGGIGGFFGALTGEDSKQAWGAVGSFIGAGLLSYSQQKQDVWAGVLGGAASGAAMGGWVGAAVGGILGGVTALMGGQDKQYSQMIMSSGGGYLGTRGQGMTDQTEVLYIAERMAEYRQTLSAFNDILRIFEDAELFDLVESLPLYDMRGLNDITVDQLAAVFRDQWLPSAFRETFQAAMERGLSGYGVSGDTMSELWREVGALPGSEQIAAIGTFVSSVVGISKLFDDMDWSSITGDVNASSMEAFSKGFERMLTAIRAQMHGIDQMGMVERAEHARNIEDMILQVRQAEIQYLQQIAQLQSQVNTALATQIEGLVLGGMSGEQQEDYYRTNIAGIMQQLRGGVGSPEELAQLMSDLTGYVNALAQLGGDQLYGGQTIENFGDWIAAMKDIGDVYASMDWQSITDAARMDDWMRFWAGLEDVVAEVREQMIGFSDFSYADQTAVMNDIGSLVRQVRQDEIAMLQQLASMQQSIATALEQQIEGFRIQEMGMGEEGTYYYQQVQSIMRRLRGGDFGSPQELQQLISDLQRYSGSMGQWYGQYGTRDIGGGSTLNQELMSLLEEAREISDAAFEGWRDEMRDSNQEQLDALLAMLEQLEAINGALGGGGDMAAIYSTDSGVPTDLLYTGTMAGELLALLREAQGLSDAAFAGFEDIIKAGNDQVVSELKEILSALRDINYTLGASDDPNWRFRRDRGGGNTGSDYGVPDDLIGFGGGGGGVGGPFTVGGKVSVIVEPTPVIIENYGPDIRTIVRQEIMADKTRSQASRQRVIS